MHIYPLPQFICKIFTALFIFIAPIQSTLLAVCLLVVADAVTGIIASMKRGERFSSSKFSASIVKLLFYTLLILVSHMIEKYLVPEIPFLQLSIYFIVFYEFSSFIENVGVITGRDLFTWFKESLNKLKIVKPPSKDGDQAQ